jgi:uncharacterized protein YecE (DUF72 family)
MTLYIGTSGFAYKEWKPTFYPEDLPQSKFLSFYSRALGACEINATFYRLQKPETFIRWVEDVPHSFRFAVKAHRRLTHSRTLAPDDNAKNFLTAYFSSVAAFGDKGGPILFQFPPYRKRDDTGFVQLLEALPQDAQVAFEFRDDSWRAPEVAERIAARGALCVADTTGDPPPGLPEGPIAYVRLRAERYTDTQRDGWLGLLSKEATTRDVFAFTKHEGTPADDAYAGLGLARWLAAQSSNAVIPTGLS